MTEEDLESSTITPEIIEPNRFIAIVKDSGLEQNKAQFLLEQFQDHYKMAAEWAKKAKTIIVTNESQVVNMKAARTGRLFLREKRLEIETARKALKESALKEGKAIDMIANFLKDLIIPTEEHLDRQEHFIEYKKKAEDDRILVEAYAKSEEERIEKEKLDAEERERLRLQNEILIQESKEKERINNEKLARLHKENEKVLQAERERTNKAENELRIKQQAEAKLEAERIKKEIELKNGSDLVKIQKFYNDLISIKFPECISPEAKSVISNSKSHIGLSIIASNKYIESNQTTEEEV